MSLPTSGMLIAKSIGINRLSWSIEPSLKNDLQLASYQPGSARSAPQVNVWHNQPQRFDNGWFFLDSIQIVNRH
jgi:hypothetical protein